MIPYLIGLSISVTPPHFPLEEKNFQVVQILQPAKGDFQPALTIEAYFKNSLPKIEIAR